MFHVGSEGGAVRASHDRPLSEMERDKFEDLLRKLTAERESVCEVMAFALDHADAHSDIVEVLQEALTLSETPVAVKVARLFVVNDILHNATAPVRGASRYRNKLEAALPYVFESLHEAYRSVESRMAQEALRRHVLRVLKAWRSRFVFSDDFLNGLQAAFLQPLSHPPIGSSCIQQDVGSSGKVQEQAEEFGRATLRVELESLSLDDLERRCRINGLVSKVRS